MWMHTELYVYLATLLLFCVVQADSYFRSKPWPSYSLHNMPQTRFTCHNKILGGYYADPETQCQMFHVCVKVAGVGVQDFRFLCPNGTAFDQEAQICSDWGDVDCETSVLYYGSDNFDLYRIGSGFDTKRAPLAEEEESTYHLQRAEIADIRRSKETRVDQKAHPDQPPNYTKYFESTTRNSFNDYVSLNVNTKTRNKVNLQPQKNRIEATKRPIASYYTPTSSTSTTTTEKYNYNADDSKHAEEFEDIFKGSHSSHFFANRNRGLEDDFIDHPIRTKPNDLPNIKKKSETPNKTRVQTVRINKRPINSTTTTSSPITHATKKLNLQTFYSSNYIGFSPAQYATTTPTTTTTSTTIRPLGNNNNNHRYNDLQESIPPSTISPTNNNIYRLKTTTAKYADNNRNEYHNFENSKLQNKPALSSTNSQKYELDNKDLKVYKQNQLNDFPKLKVQQPHPFQPSPLFRAPPQTAKDAVEIKKSKVESEAQVPRKRGQSLGTVKSVKPEPSPFVAPQRTRGTPKSKASTTTAPVQSPRGFTSRGNINYKTSTQKVADAQVSPQTLKKFSTLVPKDLYTTTTTLKSITYNSLIDYNNFQSQVTTAAPRKVQKPTVKSVTYNSLNDYNNFQSSQVTTSPAKKVQKPTVKSVTYNSLIDYNNFQSSQVSTAPKKVQKPYTTSTTTAVPTTVNPYYNADDDDGQYHPELYEVDYSNDHFKPQRSSTPSSTTTTSSTTTAGFSKPVKRNFNNAQYHLKTQQQSALQKQQEVVSAEISDEDEIFKTAQSLNFGAASINKLRADIIQAEKSSQQYNSQYSPQYAQTASPTNSPTTASFSFGTNSNNLGLVTNKPYITTTSTTTTTERPFTSTTTTRHLDYVKSSKGSAKPTKSTGLGKKTGKKSSSKRPPHSDDDTSYDYAYYDTDMSESPQEYPEYEISEFTKTHKI